MKPTNATQLRQLHLQQQQLLAQKKLAGQKLSFAQVSGKSTMPAQLIVGPKQVPTAMTVQQFQQVIRSPLNVAHTNVVLAKMPQRVIPVNTPQGTKQTVQVMKKFLFVEILPNASFIDAVKIHCQIKNEKRF